MSRESGYLRNADSLSPVSTGSHTPKKRLSQVRGDENPNRNNYSVAMPRLISFDIMLAVAKELLNNEGWLKEEHDDTNFKQH
ncbi:hypothetical protein MUK42_37288 [Musa troglodytarum]|uniref:Uncharacterized protein n=1 Tax=Musa troglodytarum TaxID=320322 RepID=A0A9E7L422_9LILI|nr:hypothetical protein MUK42_37288 [Musa troglodytarum]